MEPPSDCDPLPEVTVCIPTHNHASFLEQAVTSAATQTHPHTRIIVADDASTDGTPEIAARLVERFPNVRYHRHPQNLGRTGNADWVMRQAETEFIVRLDSDDALAPRYVEAIVGRMLAYPRAGYGHAAVTEIDGMGATRVLRQVYRTDEYEDGDHALRRAATGYRVAANILLFRREALQKVGYLNLQVADGEDYDLSIRLADAGFGNVHCPELLAFYRVFGGTQWSYHRILAEVEGYRRIYTETLPAMYRRRGWSERPLTKSRRGRARYACHLFEYDEGRSDAARATLTGLIFQLDHSWQTRLTVAASRRGLFQAIKWLDWYKWKVKRLVKNVLLARRHAPSPGRAAPR